MVLMNVLRMLADCAFYGAFAGIIAVKCGGTGAFWGILLQSLCFGLSCLGRDKRWLRLLLLLPMCLGWVVHWAALADCILLLPTAAYVVWLVWNKDYLLDQERQCRLFGVFWKLLLVLILVTLLMGGRALISAVTIPYGLVMLVCSVLLMRALRHDAKIYCQRRYQLMNLSTVIAVTAVGGLLSTQAVRNACLTALKAVYNAVLRPILEFVLNCFLALIWVISKLFAWLSVGGAQGSEEKEMPELDMTGAAELFGDDYELKEPGAFLRTLGWVLLAAVAVAALVLFFRWLNRRGEEEAAQNASPDRREVISGARRPEARRETSPVRKIRAQYRGVLKWCGTLGICPERGDTSRDIHRQISLVTRQDTLSAQIRELYIRARYAGRAGGEDAREMKRLCTQLRKNEE